jgi:cytochrome c-type biogenesis protein CcmH/NrfG
VREAQQAYRRVLRVLPDEPRAAAAVAELEAG